MVGIPRPQDCAVRLSVAGCLYSVTWRTSGRCVATFGEGFLFIRQFYDGRALKVDGMQQQLPAMGGIETGGTILRPLAQRGLEALDGGSEITLSKSLKSEIERVGDGIWTGCGW